MPKLTSAYSWSTTASNANGCKTFEPMLWYVLINTNFIPNHRRTQFSLHFQVSNKLSTQVGPKSFTIDRLMAIFYSINENKVPLTGNLLMQISNLVRLKYLTFVSGENSVMDGSARLQCTVTLNFISLVGKQVGFNVRQYLCDFMWGVGRRMGPSWVVACSS